MRDSYDDPTESLREDARVRFSDIRRELLPNENVLHVLETKRGFLVLTQRRLVFFANKKGFGLWFYMRNAFPIDCITEVNQTEADHWIMKMDHLNDSGKLEGPDKDPAVVKIEPPTQSRNERKEGLVQRTFDTTLQAIKDEIPRIQEQFRDPDYIPTTPK